MATTSTTPFEQSVIGDLRASVGGEIVLPDDEFAVAAALTTAGPYDPDAARVAWIRDTGHLTEYRVSEALVDELPAAATVEDRLTLRFEGGEPRFEPR